MEKEEEEEEREEDEEENSRSIDERTSRSMGKNEKVLNWRQVSESIETIGTIV